MKTPAVIATLTVAGSLAFAAGQQSGGKQSVIVPSGALAHSMLAQMPQAQLMAQPDCPPTLTASWFAPTPRLLECNTPYGLNLATIRGNAADINGDGRLDFWQSSRSSVLAVFNGRPYSATEDGPASGVLTVSEVGNIGGSYRVQQLTVSIFAASIGEWCLANLPSPGAPNRMVRIYLYETGQAELIAWSGWRDIDEDGDLDFVCRATDDATWNAQIWFENIGYEKPAPPVAADINGDGRVDGADLGLLLVAWGPNP